MSANSHIIREHREAKYNHLYRRKFSWFTQCLYCGEPASSSDHVFPLSLCERVELDDPSTRRALRRGLVIVPSCAECNSIARDEAFISILEKRAHIQKRLAQKYRRDIKACEWTHDEIKELGPSLRSHILSDIASSYRAQRRVSWPNPASNIEAELLAEIV